jgi:branched-chain amino acid transport system ATP-binding protein
VSLLATRDLTIRFGGHVAVNGVTCTFQPGTLTAIVGPNGAGKTTYFNLISGQLKPTAGQVTLNGRDLSGFSASERTRAGLGRAFQLTNLFPRLTVLENVRLAVQAAREGKHRRGFNLWSIWSDHRDLMARADQILVAVALADKEDELVANLPHGDQRKLEVALLMGLESHVFMFDEPTAGMNAAEVPVILNLIRKLKEDESKTILLVEHKMDVVRELADRIIVLHNGTLVADGDPATVIASPIVQEAYLGVAPQNASAQNGTAPYPELSPRAAFPGVSPRSAPLADDAPPHPGLPPRGARSEGK